jgi:hypothetical protein
MYLRRLLCWISERARVAHTFEDDERATAVFPLAASGERVRVRGGNDDTG